MTIFQGKSPRMINVGNNETVDSKYLFTRLH